MGDLPTEFIDMYIERAEGFPSCEIPALRHTQNIKYQELLQGDYKMDMFEPPDSLGSIYEEQMPSMQPLHSMQPCSYTGNGVSVSDLQNGGWSYSTAPQYEQHDVRSMGPMLMTAPDIKLENQFMHGDYGMSESCHRGSSLSPSSHDYIHSADYGYESDASVELTMDGSSNGSSSGYQQPTYEMTSKMKRNNKYPYGSQKLPQFSEILPMSLRTTHKNNRRGRPVTFIKLGHYFTDCDNFGSDEDDRGVVPRCRRGAKNILLWKFLLQELRNPNVTHVKWENEHEGTFKFVDTNECSKLWGQMKKKEDMNFEKLSRGIRHYYRDGLMSRKDGIRLVYKFNWDRVPKQFRPQY